MQHGCVKALLGQKVAVEAKVLKTRWFKTKSFSCVEMEEKFKRFGQTGTKLCTRTRGHNDFER